MIKYWGPKFFRGTLQNLKMFLEQIKGNISPSMARLEKDINELQGV
jgi:hypothetical protein